jgi:hypothetical protein
MIDCLGSPCYGSIAESQTADTVVGWGILPVTASSDFLTGGAQLVRLIAGQSFQAYHCGGELTGNYSRSVISFALVQ